MGEPIKNWSSSEVKAILQARYGGSEKSVVLFEVRNSTGHDANRAIDAVTMSLWPSLGLELTGMEIKISRSDWLRELKKPDKASATFEYFDRWFLVAPKHVAKLDEIPLPWGWLAPDGEKLVVMKPAPMLSDKKPIDRKFLAALLRCVSKGDDKLIEAAISRQLEVERKRLNDIREEQIKREVDSRTGRLADDAKAWRDLKERLGADASYLTVNEVVHALGVIRRLGLDGTYGALSGLTSAIERSSVAIAAALAQLKAPETEDQKGAA